MAPSAERIGSKKSRRPNRALASVIGLSFGTQRFASNPSGMSLSDIVDGNVSLGGAACSGPLAPIQPQKTRPKKRKPSRCIQINLKIPAHYSHGRWFGFQAN